MDSLNKLIRKDLVDGLPDLHFERTYYAMRVVVPKKNERHDLAKRNRTLAIMN